MSVYDDEHLELFLKLVNEYWNMTETYEILTGDQTLLFNRFRRCLRAQARASWDITVHGITLEKATLDISFKKLIVEIVG